MPRPQMPRSDRIRTRIVLEALESRRLLSAVNRMPATAPAQVSIPNFGATVSQLSDSAVVTLQRGNNLKGTIQVAVSTEPLPGSPPPVQLTPVGPSNALAPALPLPVGTSGLPRAVAGQHYTPIRELVTFADGEETRTVTIPLIAGTEGPGERALPIYVTPASAGVQGVSGTLKLVDKLDVTPPTIVGARLVGPRGGSGGGIELTFSEPMDPATVGNPANYAVGEYSHRSNPFDTFSFVLTGNTVSQSHSAKVKITSAGYDPEARTVTLAVAKPLKTSMQYTVANPRPRRAGRGSFAPIVEAGKLTDTSGNPINGGGLVTGMFSVSVAGTAQGASRSRGGRPGRS